MALGGTMRGSHRLLGLVPLPVLTGGLIVGAFLGFLKPQPSDRLPPLTFVQGVDVGGLSEAEAQRLLKARLAPLLDLKVVLLVGGRRIQATWRKLGASLDIERALREARGGWRPSPHSILSPTALRPVPVRASFDEGRLLRFLRALARRVNRPPKDARLIWLGRGRRRIVPERYGFALEVEESASLIKKVGRWPRTAVVALPLRSLKPRVTAEDLRPVTDIIGAFTTWFDPGNKNRAHNIRLVARRLRGVVVMPGEVFSFNRAVGPRTKARGFLPAPIFVKGEIATGIGGGVCQVSTTLYNAAKRAGMKIVERHLHSLPVHYVPSGYDATVVYGALDMRFKNPYSHPVVIWTAVKGGALTVLILGPPRSLERKGGV